MSDTATAHASLKHWIGRESISFSPGSRDAFIAAVGALMASLGDSVELLGMGEPLHGSEEVLELRNRLFQRLVEAHGFRAIAIESSFPRGLAANEYVAGGDIAWDVIQETGFSHGFGQSRANRELVEWMRRRNADPAFQPKLRFHGFDGPTEMTHTDSPRPLLQLALDRLACLDGPCAEGHRRRIEPLLGEDAAWENPAAMMDPTQSIGLTPEATALRIETENLIIGLRLRRPQWVASGTDHKGQEALRCATLALQLLDYHAQLAGHSPERVSELLGLRDLMMADNLDHIAAQERGRGRVLAFAHNTHLQRGRAQWQLGPMLCVWWPAGAHLQAMLGSRWAVVGTAVNVSQSDGIGPAEAGTLEALLAAAPGPARLAPTHRGEGLPAAAVAALPVRSPSAANSTFFPLTSQSLSDFDWLLTVDLGTAAANTTSP